LFHGGRHFQSLAMCIDRGRGGVLGRVVGFGHGSKQRCLSGWSLGWFQAPLQHQLKSLVILLGIKSRHYLIDRTNSGGRGSPPTISLIERAPRQSRYNDPYKDYLGKPRKNNVRSARPKREKIKKRLHGHITNSNTSQEYTKCILPIVHGTSAEQLACQVHRSQSATTIPLAATPLCGHPPTIWEGLPTEWGLRVSGAS